MCCFTSKNETENFAYKDSGTWLVEAPTGLDDIKTLILKYNVVKLISTEMISGNCEHIPNS